MGKLVVSEFLTLDLMMQDPGGADGTIHGGWQRAFFTPKIGEFKLKELMATNALLLGRKTYDGFAQAWPSMPDDGAGFAKRMNSLPKYVVSDTPNLQHDWEHSTLIAGSDIKTEVKKLKQTILGNILVFGSSQLVRTLIGYGLIDEYSLMIHPVILGEGIRLFDGAKKTDLLLVSQESLDAGVVVLNYMLAAQ